MGDDAPVAEPLGAEELAVLPEVVWLDVGGIETPSAGVMAGWVEEGARKASIDDETDHVDAEVLRGMLAAKSALDLLDDSRAFSDARARANPFEGIKKEFFLNRAALKMAAIDTALEGIFSCADAPDPPSAYDEAVSWHYRAASEAARGQHAAPGSRRRRRRRPSRRRTRRRTRSRRWPRGPSSPPRQPRPRHRPHANWRRRSRRSRRPRTDRSAL